MAQSPAEKHREITNSLSTLVERIDSIRNDSEALSKRIDEERSMGRARDKELAELRQEIELSRQKLEDHLKRVDTWSNRVWTLIPVMIGAILSLAAGLIVALARKTP